MGTVIFKHDEAGNMFKVSCTPIELNMAITDLFEIILKRECMTKEELHFAVDLAATPTEDLEKMADGLFKEMFEASKRTEKASNEKEIYAKNAEDLIKHIMKDLRGKKK